MIKQITFQIDCGETTCGTAEKGITCLFFGTKKFGTVPVCMLFDKQLYEGAENSWVQRCSECLEKVT